MAIVPKYLATAALRLSPLNDLLRHEAPLPPEQIIQQVAAVV
jgi:hypothetical protein